MLPPERIVFRLRRVYPRTLSLYTPIRVQSAFRHLPTQPSRHVATLCVVSACSPL